MLRLIFYGTVALLGCSGMAYVVAVAIRSSLLGYVAAGGMAGGLLLFAGGVLIGPVRRR